MTYPVCIPCGKRMFATRNGVKAIEFLDQSHKDAYRIWSVDLFECPVCGARAVGGWSQKPTYEHFQPTFQEQLKQARSEEFTIGFD